MKKFCVIGRGIGYSLSPLVHSIIYAQLGLNAEYKITDIAELDKECVGRLKDEYDGFNVTKPYKKEIARYLDGVLSDFDSINTVVNNGRLIGYNTDFYGFRMDFSEKSKSITTKTAMVLGSGGAAETVVPALRSLGYLVRIQSRNEQTKKELEEVYDIDPTLDFYPAVIINCTPVGIHLGDLRPEYVYELKYDSDATTMLWCANKGIRYDRGLGMLVYQAVAADEIFFGLSLDYGQKRELGKKVLQILTEKL